MPIGAWQESCRPARRRVGTVPGSSSRRVFFFSLTACNASRSRQWNVDNGRRVTWIGSDELGRYPRVRVEHVEDFDELGVSLWKRKPTPYILEPKEEFDDGEKSFITGAGWCEFFKWSPTITLRAHISSSSSTLITADNLYDCTQKNARHLIGAPVLTLDPIRFVGIITAVDQHTWLESGQASFCLLTTNSPAWVKIEAAMECYRNTIPKSKPTPRKKTMLELDEVDASGTDATQQQTTTICIDSSPVEHPPSTEHQGDGHHGPWNSVCGRIRTLLANVLKCRLE